MWKLQILAFTTTIEINFFISTFHVTVFFFRFFVSLVVASFERVGAAGIAWHRFVALLCSNKKLYFFANSTNVFRFAFCQPAVQYINFNERERDWGKKEVNTFAYCVTEQKEKSSISVETSIEHHIDVDVDKNRFIFRWTAHTLFLVAVQFFFIQHQCEQLNGSLWRAHCVSCGSLSHSSHNGYKWRTHAHKNRNGKTYRWRTSRTPNSNSICMHNSNWTESRWCALKYNRK